MEAAPLNTSFYKEALIVLGAAAIVIPLFHRLHVSSVLGFMLVGVAVGPFGLASFAPYLPWVSAITISEPESIEPIAHLGVVLLLFMIGLELSFERLKVMRRLVFGLGSLQLVLCAAVLAGAAVLLGYSGISARATLRNSGRSTRRPRATIAAIASSACPTARPKPATLPAWLVGPSAARTSSTGTTARS